MANAMDKITEAREKLMQRAETARSRMGGSGGSGGRLLMGGGGYMKGANVQERMNEVRTRVQTRIKGVRQTRAAGRDGPLDIIGGGGGKKVETIDLPPATTTRKVISV